MKTLKMLKPAVGKFGCPSGAMHSNSMGQEGLFQLMWLQSWRPGAVCAFGEYCRACSDEERFAGAPGISDQVER